MKHLWEADHPYYCNEANYYSRDPYSRYKSWADFFESEGDADPDYNLVFRFDWKEGDGWGGCEYNGDDHYRNGILKIFWMGQRKGIFRCTEIEVCRADEPAVLEFLKPRWEHMRRLWEPIAKAGRGGVMTPEERARKIVAPLPFGYQTDSAKQLHADIVAAIREAESAAYRRGLEGVIRMIILEYPDSSWKFGLVEEIRALAEKEPTND